MRIIKGNILDVEEGIIIHQVNCFDVMGAGVAKSLYTKYPVIKETYHRHNKKMSKENLFGKMSVVKVTNNLYVVNSYSQYGYGNSRYTNIVYTDYDKLLNNIKRVISISNGLPVYIPYGIGCGLAGGNWDVLQSLIQDLDIIVVKM